MQYGGRKCKKLLDWDEICYWGGFSGSLITNRRSIYRNSKWRIQYSGQKWKKLLDWDALWYWRVFGVADYESELKIEKLKIAYPRWWPRVWKIIRLCWKFVSKRFLGRWLQIWSLILVIRHNGSILTVRELKNYSIWMKRDLWEPLCSLINDSSKDFHKLPPKSRFKNIRKIINFKDN